MVLRMCVRHGAGLAIDLPNFTLREWQAQALDAALERSWKLGSTTIHAAPGAGRTRSPEPHSCECGPRARWNECWLSSQTRPCGRSGVSPCRRDRRSGHPDASCTGFARRFHRNFDSCSTLEGHLQHPRCSSQCSTQPRRGSKLRTPVGVC
jgi:hypothetical protein